MKTLTLREQITAEATRWLRSHNRGIATALDQWAPKWECPVCGDLISLRPPTDHAKDCSELREAALDRLDARDTQRRRR